MSHPSHYSIFGKIYNEPAMKGIRKLPKPLSKEHPFRNPRYSYLTDKSVTSNSSSTANQKGDITWFI